MQKPGRTFVSQSISFPPELLALAKERAMKLGMPFSTYVQKCVERDLSERGAIVFEECKDFAVPSARRTTAQIRTAK